MGQHICPGFLLQHKVGGIFHFGSGQFRQIQSPAVSNTCFVADSESSVATREDNALAATELLFPDAAAMSMKLVMINPLCVI